MVSIVPKCPLNAFILFARRRRSQIGGKVTDSSKLLAKEWKNMRKIEKKKYCAEAQALKTEFRQSFPEFKYTRHRKQRLRQESVKPPRQTLVKGLLQRNAAEGVSLAEPKPAFNHSISGRQDCPSEAATSQISNGGNLHLDHYEGSYKSHWANHYPYEGNRCLWEVDEKWGLRLDKFDRIR
ncbi:hypothetical protein B0H13DRAFT_1904699 [Mycena leptocephala]|nr:hypothetical protein B0H13DRAFT_1904699 [Mycena leptocephala]